MSVVSTRIVGVDAARCLALLGMVLAHLAAFNRAGDDVGVTFQVTAGRSAALFAVLAGVSIALLDPSRRQLVVRALLLAGLGLLLGAVPTGVAVILTYYGALFLLALPVLGWGARSLALLALGWGLLSPVASQLLRPHLPDASYQVPAPWSLADPAQLGAELLVTGYYPVLTWGTYLFAGMALGRLDLRARAWGPRLLVVGAWLAVAALAVDRWLTREGVVREALVASWDRPWARVSDWGDLEVVLSQGLYGTTPTGSWWWLTVWSPHSGSVVDMAHTVGTAVAVLGGCLLLARAVPTVARVALGAGTMTLTLYVAHVLTVGLPDAVPGAHDPRVHVVGLLVTGALVVSSGSKGPLEALVAWLSGTASRRPAPP